MKNTVAKIAVGGGMALIGLIGVWAFVTLIAGLRQSGWQMTELLRQYMVATGMIKPLHTLVDFYTHIKGVEYLICVAFPAFYRYVSKEDKEVRSGN